VIYLHIETIFGMSKEVNIVNRKVKFEYEFIETYIAGIQLLGTEVKSIRNGEVSLVDTFCIFNKGELIAKNIKIQKTDTSFSHEPLRDRKLLLNKKELKSLHKQLIDGLTIVPYRLFTNNKGLIKVEIVLAKGKKIYDKRQSIKTRDLNREMKKEL
jgi:SsrA-binding protein